jgi:hypothetical protein
VSRRSHRPPLLVSSILAWADAFYARAGRWPDVRSGPVQEAPWETWRTIYDALRRGRPGLPGPTTLACLLAQERGVPHRAALPPISLPQILRWVDAHHERHKTWPIIESGAIPEAPGETWLRVDNALRTGSYGLPLGMTLRRLLRQERGARYARKTPFFTIERILAWADDYHARTGNWPSSKSGPIPELPGVSWVTVQNALSIGRRGLPGGSSLPRLLAEHRDVRNRLNLPALDIPQILYWVKAFRARTRKWPKAASGPILESPGERWSSVDKALRCGARGLPGKSSLAILIHQKFRNRLKYRREKLSIPQILAWADAHYERHGSWPTRFSGRIPEARSDTWKSVCQALLAGWRGLPGGTTLARLLQVERKSPRQTAAPMHIASPPPGTAAPEPAIHTDRVDAMARRQTSTTVAPIANNWTISDAYPQ